MKAKDKFYVTTPIYYPTDIPHIGHAYTTLAADVLSRWNKLLGKEVFFLVGTDEHGKKIENAAEKANKTPKKFVDHLVPEFEKAWKILNIHYNRFIRTTDLDHEQVVKTILTELHKKGDIYEGYYEGYYCTGCEAYYTEKDLVDGCCPIHQVKIEKLKEESYFFKLSKYQNKLLDYYKKNPEFLQPESKRNEILSRLKEGLRDLSISRNSFSWGIPLPFDKEHIAYVWVDAILNYISGIGYLDNSKKFNKFWPADVQLIGKDILWFHAVIWPAVLMSTGIDLPKKIFAHGWWTFNKEKISKSRGKVINVEELTNIAGVDSARYFLFREIPFGEDGDFSQESLIDRHNNELANKLGNLVSRVSTLVETYGIEKTKPLDSKKTVKMVEKYLESLEFDKALSEIFAFIDICNEYVQTKKPWETKDKKVLYQLANAIKDFTILLSPFIPETADKISRVFKFEITWDQLQKQIKSTNIKKSEILFKKIENKIPIKQEVNNKVNKTQTIPGIMDIQQIKYDDFAKIDLRVGTIKKAEDIEGADKLLKLEVEIGAEKKTILAGIKKYYKKESLIGKQVVCVVNLEPRKMKGLESQGMLLAAGNKDDTCVLISPEKPVKSGLKIS